MPIEVECPNPKCKKVLRAPDEHAGKKARCPGCGHIITVPEPMAVLVEASADPLVGSKLGMLHIKEKLGEGGMGAVYLAINTSLDRMVAVKVLPRELLKGNPKYLDRFLREAKMAAKLTHPNAVIVYSVGEHKGRHFIEMEFVQGMDLRQIIEKQGRVEPKEASRIIKDAASALAAAHKQGIIHRDIKPDNIMLTEEGQVKVADFGLARVAAADSSLTVSGQVMGTPLYMSPEQGEAKASDGRTDIYSLGATYYHALVGQVPFTADTPLQIMFKHVQQPLSWPKEAEDIPSEIRAIIEKMMAKNPDDRYQNCDEVIEAIEDCFKPKAVMGRRVQVATRVQQPVPMATPPKGAYVVSAEQLAAIESTARSLRRRTPTRKRVAKPVKARKARPKWLPPVIGVAACVLVAAVLVGIVMKRRGKAPTAPAASAIAAKPEPPVPGKPKQPPRAKIPAVTPPAKAPPAAPKPDAEGFVSLFNGKDLTGWKLLNPSIKGWGVQDGVLVNNRPSTDLLTERQFSDFLFHCEFRVPRGGNSGIYLRGRYELQIMDDSGRPAGRGSSGGIWGQIAPSVNASKSAGEWQTLDVQLIGKRVTVILNGKKVVADAELRQPTQGALDQNVDQPGPILLQGSLGAVAFRNIRIKELAEPAAPDAEGWVSLFDGKTLDGWQVRKGGRFEQGSARVEDGRIILSGGRPAAGIGWKGRFPSVDYEVELEAMRIGRKNCFCAIGFPIGTRRATLAVADCNNSIVGLDGVDGKDAKDNVTARPMRCEDNRWYRVRLHVTEARVQAWVDGTEVVNLPTVGHTFAPAEPAPFTFMIFTWDADAAVRNIRMRSLKPEQVALPQPDAEGFVPLFNGKDLTGWTGPSKGYGVENGLLISYRSGPPEPLLTEKEYGDFILRFQFRLKPGANNGVVIRTPLEGIPTYAGMEIQLLDDSDDKWKQYTPWQRHGAIVGVAAPKPSKLRPAPEWNAAEVMAKGPQIVVSFNGETVVDVDLDKIGARTLDGKDHPGLKRDSGHIGFLGVEGRTEFWKIRIKDLSAQAKSYDGVYVTTAATGEKIPHPLSQKTYEIAYEGKKIEVPEGMVFVPGGPFIMGDDGIPDASPAHEVNVDAFFIDKYEVTNAQYMEFVKATGHRMPKHFEENEGKIPQGRENHPVTTVSWEDAKAYCDWCGKRLPTEAEWEKAAGWDARQKAKRTYPWGEEPPETGPPRANWAGTQGYKPGSMDPDVWRKNWKEERKEFLSLGGSSTPVGTFPNGMSPYGCYDLAGNVREYLEDRFRRYPGNTTIPEESLVDRNGREKRTQRGGFWGHFSEQLRCAHREAARVTVTDVKGGNGFRCAVDVPWEPATEPTGAARTEPKKRHEGTRVWIDDVPTTKLGQLGDDWTLQLKGLQVLLSHRSEPVGPDELLTCSGEAFNLCHSDHWELRTYLALPIDSLGEASKAYGYDSRWVMGGQFHQMKKKGVEACRKQLQAVLDELWREIDAGRPVLVSGVDGHSGNWYVAAGYDRTNEQMYYIGGQKPKWGGISGLNIDTCGDPKVGKLGFWDSCVRGAIRPNFLGGWWSDVGFILGEKTHDVSEKDRTVTTLRLATHMFRPGKLAATRYFGVTYYFGEKAYEQWAKDLRGLDFPADTQKPRPRTPEIYDLSTMIYQVQQIVRGRAAAARFCERSAKVLPQVGGHVGAAAKAYREQVSIAEDRLAPFLSGSEKQWQGWLCKESEREAGANAILQMLDKEKAAITEITKALASLE